MTITRTFTDGDDRFGVNTNDSYELTFLGGNDRLITRAGTTTAYMGVGNDFVRVEGGLAQIFGQAGTDRFEVYGSNSRLHGGGGNDAFVLRGGSDHRFRGSEGDDRFNIVTDTANVFLRGDEGNDSFFGHSNSISGELSGGAGADRFFDFGNHGGRTVTLYGGTGNDLYRVDPGSPPTIVEHSGEGTDTVQIASGVTYTLGTNLENLVALGSNNDSHLTGNELGNRIFGGGGDDAIQGLSGNDRLYGNGNRDLIDGGAGNDRIWGGLAGDAMTGGEGADIFVYGSAADAPYDPFFDESDWIADWGSSDRIDLSVIDANTEVDGVQHFNVVNGSGDEPGTLYFESDPAGWGWVIVEGHIDGDGQPDVFILITAGVDMFPAVTEESFIVG